MKKAIEDNPLLGDDMHTDFNITNNVMVISYFLRTFRLIILITNVSFFFGIIWLIWCDLSSDFRVYLNKLLQNNSTDESFIDFFHIHFISNSEEFIIAFYFAFTSVTTVGLGDFHPRSDQERLLCSALLLGGVTLFSYIMGNFISILEQFKIMNKDVEQEDLLQQFLCQLVFFNGGMPLSKDFTTSIHQFFLYRWQKDRNVAIRENMLIFQQLPDDVQNKLYTTYLFQNFLQKYT